VKTFRRRDTGDPVYVYVLLEFQSLLLETRFGPHAVCRPCLSPTPAAAYRFLKDLTCGSISTLISRRKVPPT